MAFLQRVQEFIREVLAEFRRVTWPSRQELINATVVVVAVTVILAFFLGAVDVALARIVERVLR
jgi:preprotein translocase subunit SecE